jgi:hypothetical protein
MGLFPIGPIPTGTGTIEIAACRFASLRFAYAAGALRATRSVLFFFKILIFFILVSVFS